MNEDDNVVEKEKVDDEATEATGDAQTLMTEETSETKEVVADAVAEKDTKLQTSAKDEKADRPASREKCSPKPPVGERSVRVYQPG